MSEKQQNTQTPSDEKEEKIRFPKSCKVVNADGDKIGKVRKSVYYNNDKEEQGKFFSVKETGEVLLKKRPLGTEFISDSAYTETVGYVDEHDDVFTPAGEYLATLKYRKWFLLLIFFLILCFVALILSMLFIDVTRDYIPTLFVEDVNDYEIGMGYRLLRNGVCVSGGEYVYVAELNSAEFTVGAGQSDTFTLEWAWLHNDSVDTIAGMEDATYILNISFHAYIQNSH